jgi:hypothetical protein
MKLHYVEFSVAVLMGQRAVSELVNVVAVELMV